MALRDIVQTCIVNFYQVFLEKYLNVGMYVTHKLIMCMIKLILKIIKCFTKLQHSKAPFLELHLPVSSGNLFH